MLTPRSSGVHGTVMGDESLHVVLKFRNQQVLELPIPETFGPPVALHFLMYVHNMCDEPTNHRCTNFSSNFSSNLGHAQARYPLTLCLSWAAFQVLTNPNPNGSVTVPISTTRWQEYHT